VAHCSRPAEWLSRVIESEDALARAEEFRGRRPGPAADLVHRSAIKRLRSAKLEHRLAILFHAEERDLSPHLLRGPTDEAKNQLRQRSVDCEIVARGICCRGPLIPPGLRVMSRQGPLEFEPVTIEEREIPSAAFHPNSEIVWHCNTIAAAGGRVYNDVRYRRKDVDRLWPPGSIVRQKRSPDEVEAWVLNYGKEREDEGRLVDRSALIKGRLGGATERQILKSYRDDLPDHQKKKRGYYQRGGRPVT
jgi:hypothetical protein